METLLDNPVYNALLSGDARLSFGTDTAKYFDKEVSPYAGFSDEYKEGFDELHELLPADRKILYATRKLINEPKGWQLLRHIEGSQFVLASKKSFGGKPTNAALVPLEPKHADEMVRSPVPDLLIKEPSSSETILEFLKTISSLL